MVTFQDSFAKYCSSELSKEPVTYFEGNSIKVRARFGEAYLHARQSNSALTLSAAFGLQKVNQTLAGIVAEMERFVTNSGCTTGATRLFEENLSRATLFFPSVQSTGEAFPQGKYCANIEILGGQLQEAAICSCVTKGIEKHAGAGREPRSEALNRNPSRELFMQTILENLPLLVDIQACF